MQNYLFRTSQRVAKKAKYLLGYSEMWEKDLGLDKKVESIDKTPAINVSAQA